jgi:hypothetical protein
MAFIIYTFFDLSTLLLILQAYLNLINPNFLPKNLDQMPFMIASGFCSQKLIDLSIVPYFQSKLAQKRIKRIFITISTTNKKN